MAVIAWNVDGSADLFYKKTVADSRYVRLDTSNAVSDLRGGFSSSGSGFQYTLDDTGVTVHAHDTSFNVGGSDLEMDGYGMRHTAESASEPVARDMFTAGTDDDRLCVWQTDLTRRSWEVDLNVELICSMRIPVPTGYTNFVTGANFRRVADADSEPTVNTTNANNWQDVGVNCIKELSTDTDYPIGAFVFGSSGCSWMSHSLTSTASTTEFCGVNVASAKTTINGYGKFESVEAACNFIFNYFATGGNTGATRCESIFISKDLWYDDDSDLNYFTMQAVEVISGVSYTTKLRCGIADGYFHPYTKTFAGGSDSRFIDVKFFFMGDDTAYDRLVVPNGAGLDTFTGIDSFRVEARVPGTKSMVTMGNSPMVVGPNGEKLLFAVGSSIGPGSATIENIRANDPSDLAPRNAHYCASNTTFGVDEDGYLLHDNSGYLPASYGSSSTVIRQLKIGEVLDTGHVGINRTIAGADDYTEFATLRVFGPGVYLITLYAWHNTVATTSTTSNYRSRSRIKVSSGMQGDTTFYQEWSQAGANWGSHSTVGVYYNANAGDAITFTGAVATTQSVNSRSPYNTGGRLIVCRIA